MSVWLEIKQSHAAVRFIRTTHTLIIVASTSVLSGKILRNVYISNENCNCVGVNRHFSTSVIMSSSPEGHADANDRISFGTAVRLIVLLLFAESKARLAGRRRQ